MPRNDPTVFHSPPVEFAAEIKYTSDHASLYVIDKLGGDRKQAHQLLPSLNSLLRDIGKTTFTQQQCDGLVSLIGSYPALGAKASFATTKPTTAGDAEYTRLMQSTPLGQNVLAAQKGGK